MNILAIDTAARLCAACVLDAGTGVERARSVRDIGKGHAEQLMEVIGEALAAAGLAYADVGRVAVSVGPGSFTGIRVGIATARGLAMALDVPAIGITTLEALASEAGIAGPVMSAIDAGRDGLYVAVYDAFGKVVHAPRIATVEEAAAMAEGCIAMICGSGADRIAVAMGRLEKAIAPKASTADILVYARLAASTPLSTEKPSPLYLRAPDAKPQTNAILTRRPG